MANTVTVYQEPQNFLQGLVLLQDDIEAPFGSAREMLNCMITDRGGISPRPGTRLLGTHNPTIKPVRGMYNFRKSLGAAEILLKGYDEKLEYYHSTLSSDWALLKSGFTDGQEFGFVETLVNPDNDDFVYFCNRTEPYQRWRGAVTILTGNLSGGETVINVQSVLKPSILESKTSSASSSTTLDVADTPWADSQWVNFYVKITSGALSGKIRKITANTSSQITFEDLGSDPGSGCTFEIRIPAFPPSGSIVYGGNIVAYTAIDTETTFVTASASAGTTNMTATLIPEEFPGAPRGNRLESVVGRVYVGNVRSALSRDSGGALQGSAAAGSVFVSKISDPSDFSFAASRVAGDGDIINMPYGGGDINDIKGQENFAYVYKKDYVEAIRYTGDTDDIAVRTPLKTNVGSVSKVIKGQDDQFFINLEKEFTSLGRVKLKDNTPQTENMGLRIKRLLDQYEHDQFTGIEFRNRIISTHRSSAATDRNDVMLVFNQKTKSYEGIWSLGANNFDIFNGLAYFASAIDANIWQLFSDRKVDFQDADTIFPYTARWKSNFFSIIGKNYLNRRRPIIHTQIQKIQSIYLEGRIKTNSKFTFKMFRDFSNDPFLQFDFRGIEDEFMTSSGLSGSFLGGEPLGLSPIGTLDEEVDGWRRFAFLVYFPFQYARYFADSFESTGKDQDWEILKVGFGIQESTSTKTDHIKSL